MNIEETSEAPREAGRSRRLSPLAWMVFAIVIAVVVAAVAFVGESLGHRATTGATAGATISVTGSGTVTGTPNTMSFQMGVQTEASSAVAALEENNAKMASLEATLMRHGITKKGLQTSDLSLYTDTNSNGVITGFSASDELNVTTHALASAGAAIDAAARAVGNDVQLSGVTFSISNQSKYLAAARARAMRNARAEANQVAAGGGTKVLSIVKVTDEENTGSTGIVFPYTEFASAAAKNVPVEAGSQSISVQVKVVYALAS